MTSLPTESIAIVKSTFKPSYLINTRAAAANLVRISLFLLMDKLICSSGPQKNSVAFRTRKEYRLFHNSFIVPELDNNRNLHGWILTGQV
jgi:hypothetical protein